MINFYVDSKHKMLKNLLASFIMQTSNQRFKVIFVGDTKLDEKTIKPFLDKIDITYLKDVPFNFDEIVSNQIDALSSNDIITLVDDKSFLYDIFSIQNIEKIMVNNQFSVIYSLIYDKSSGSYIQNKDSKNLNFYSYGFLTNQKELSDDCTDANDVIFYKS